MGTAKCLGLFELEVATKKISLQLRTVQQTADNLVKHRSFIGGQRKKET